MIKIDRNSAIAINPFMFVIQLHFKDNIEELALKNLAAINKVYKNE